MRQPKNFHYVIYPVNSNGDLNFIAIMKYRLSVTEQKNFSSIGQQYPDSILNYTPNHIHAPKPYDPHDKPIEIAK